MVYCQEANQYLVEHFVSSGILESYSREDIRRSLDTLHSKLSDMPREIACELYLCKARELADFGAHFHSVYRSAKCTPQSSAWLAVSPKGLYLFEVKRSGMRRRLHSFTWEHMAKIGYKNNGVTLWTKEGIKMKVHARSYHKAKYLVGIIGSMHQFYTFEEFRYGRSLHFFSHPKEESCPPFHPNCSKKQIEHKKPRHSNIIQNEPSSGTSSRSLVQEMKEMNRDDTVNGSATQKNHSYEDESAEVNAYSYAEDDKVPSHNNPSQPSQHHEGHQNLPHVPGSFEITLEKLHGNFGFSIMGGVDKPTGLIKVQQIVEGGAAERSGMLQKGDIILGINRMSLCGVTHRKSVEIFSQAPDKSTLIVQSQDFSSESESTFEESEVALAEQVEEETSQIQSQNFIEVEAQVQNTLQETDFYNIQVPEEFADPVERQDNYDDRVMQVATAFYNQQYTDVESDFQNTYIGSGSEDVVFMVGSDVSQDGDRENLDHNLASRGEGDGVSTLSNQDHKLQHSDSSRNSSAKSQSQNIPKAASEAIQDFVEFKRRISELKKANYGSSNSAATSQDSLSNGTGLSLRAAS